MYCETNKLAVLTTNDITEGVVFKV